MKVIASPAFKNKYKNPYNWLLYSPMEQQGASVEEFSPRSLLRKHYDIFHFHWPAELVLDYPNAPGALARGLIMLLLIDFVRARGTRIVWTYHDIAPRKMLYPKLGEWFRSAFASRVDGFISLSKIGKVFAEKQYPVLENRPNAVVPHGHYREVYPNEVSKDSAKSQLNLSQECKTLVFFGQIRPYKNVPHLIRTFRELAPPDWVLVIAGMPDTPESKQEVLEAAESDPRVKLILQFIKDEDVQLYLNAADLVVLPFQETLNSGSIFLALSFDCPVLVAEQGSIGEVKEQVGEAWVSTYSGELNPDILQEGLKWAVQSPRSETAPLEAYEWSKLSQETIDFYQTVCKR